MVERSQTVHHAIMLLCNTGIVDPAQAFASMELYREDMVKKLHAAIEEGVELRLRMVQADIAKCDEVMDALICASIES